jgi:hypothetical protein
VILCIEELNSVRIIFTEYLLENINIVVFATEAKHKHACRVGVVNHTAKDLLSYSLIIAKLRAAEGMRKISRTGKLGKLLRYFINASNGVYDPNFISDTNVSVLTNITHKGTVGRSGRSIIKLRSIAILKVAGKIGLYIMCMNVLTLLYVTGSVTYGVAVLDDIFSTLDVSESILVAVIKIYIYVIKLIN